ncbi:MAG TPA: glycosyltransferase family 4 protein [Anaerolineae bacterium]|nr:glycosyltransferase family 4 protein [Anaerolineae bacterium]
MSTPAPVQAFSVLCPDDPASPPGVLFVIGCEGDTVRYRCNHPGEQLAYLGVRTQHRSWRDPRLFSDALEYNIFILHRVMHTGLIPDLLDLLRRLGKVTIFDTDDLTFDPALARYDSQLATLSVDQARRYRQNIELQAQTLERSAYTLTTTQFLADQLQRCGKRTFINRNSLNSEQVRLAEAAHHNPYSSADRVTIGYFSGSPSHERDFAVAAPALLRLMERYPQVHLGIFGHLAPDRRFARFGDRVQRVAYMNWQELPQAIRQVDINIAPLDVDNPFCQSKSELKYFEAGIVGVPTVASPTDAFKFAITQGENGFLAGTTQEWLSHLELLTVDPERRQQIGAAAREHVIQHYTPNARSAGWLRTVHQIWHDWQMHRPAPPIELQSTRTVIDQMMQCLSNLIVLDDPSRAEKEITHFAKTLRGGRNRLPYKIWTWVKAKIKRGLRLNYTHAFFNQPCVLSSELIAGTEPSGHFTATQPGLYRLDIPFATHDRTNTPEVNLHLRSSPHAHEDLVTVCVPGALLRDNQPYRFIFQPIPDSQGREFYYYLESPQATPGNAVSLWMTQGVRQPVCAPRYWSGDESV